MSVDLAVPLGLDSLAFAPDGRLFISSLFDGRVFGIGDGGASRELTGAPSGQPNDDGAQPWLFGGDQRNRFAGADGSIAFGTAGGQIVHFDSAGRATELASGLLEVCGMAIGRGCIDAAEAGAARVISVGGSEGFEVVASGLGRPMAVACDHSGVVYVADAEVGRVVRIDGDRT